MRQPSTKRLIELIHMRPRTPLGKIGDVEIDMETVPAGTPINVVSMRNAIFMGLKPLNVSFDSPLVIRQLKYEGGTWMTDHPQELWQMDDAVKKMRGKVLVGGLGLGVFTTFANYRPQIARTLTVEMDQRIIDLVGKHCFGVYDHDTVEQANLFDVVRDLKPGKFDSAFFDIWQSTGEISWTSMVVPLRRMARGKIKKVVCWLENEMGTQVIGALTRFASMPDGIRSAPHYEAFRNALDRKKVSRTIVTDVHDFHAMIKAEAENQENRTLMAMARLFCYEAGSDRWEREFGECWDKAFASDEERHAKASKAG